MIGLELSVQWALKTLFLSSQWSLSTTNVGLKEPTQGKKKPHDTTKRMNIHLFHIESCFSLSMDLKRPMLQNLPLFKKMNYFPSIRQLSGGERLPLTMSRYQLKMLKVIVPLKLHTSQMAQTILQQLVSVLCSHLSILLFFLVMKKTLFVTNVLLKEANHQSILQSLMQSH